MRYDKIARAQLREGKLVCARYVGPRDDLRGETALVRLPRRKGESGELMVQLDAYTRWPELSHGWHPFKRSDFKLQPSVVDWFAVDTLAKTFRKHERERALWAYGPTRLAGGKDL